MPYSPSNGLTASTSSRRASLPALRRSSIEPLRTRRARPSRSRDTPAAATLRSGWAGPFVADVANDSAHKTVVSLSRYIVSHRSTVTVDGPVDRPTSTRQRSVSLALCAGDPAGFVHLLAARDRERVLRHVVGDRGSGGDVGVLADSHRRDQLAVGADECAVLDDRRVIYSRHRSCT